MKYITLANSNLNVSRLTLGCMSFGEVDQGPYQWTLDYEQSKQIIDKAIEYGINFFDTSNNYSNGTSEQFLGRAIKDYNRKDLIIATKCYFNEGKLSPEAIHNEISKSLKNLDTNYIDLYIMHRYDYDTPVQDTLKALNEEVYNGRIRYYGLSAMYPRQFEEYCLKARSNHYLPIVSLQNHYSLLYREDEKELIPIATRLNVSRTSFAPLAAGRLTRKIYEANTNRFSLDSKQGTRYDNTIMIDKPIIERVSQIADKYNCSMANIALAWQFKKGVASPIIGVTKMEYLDDAIKSLDINLTDEDVKYLEELYLPHPINCNR